MQEFNFPEDLCFDMVYSHILKNGGVIGLSVLKTVQLPEADVLCCMLLGKRVNVKFDLVYGVSMELIDVCSDEEINTLLEFIRS